MKIKGYLFWLLLVVICYLFILYGWIKEIEWMIPTFFIAGIIFATLAATTESEDIKTINNLWDDLDSLKQKVSNLEDMVYNLKLEDAKKQDEAEKMDKYITKTVDYKTGKATLKFDPPLCPYPNMIVRIETKKETEEDENS